MMEFLTGNPFSTPVGQRIEQATSSSLQTEDWALNMEICDIVNSADEGPKDAVRAIKKRIAGNKNFREVMLTLTVLEACVKNCGHKFHVLVSTRDFIEGVLVRAIIPRNNPPAVVHDRVLSVIQAWADAFRSSPDLTGVVSVYEDLRRKGLEFPTTELDGYHNQNKSLPGKGSAITLPTPTSTKPPSIPPETKPNQKELGIFDTKQVKKLKEDMVVVTSNLTVMADMMSQLDPVTAKHTDVELLQQLYVVCKEMQDRIVELVPKLNEEKLIQELLAANDEMNTTFTRYQRFERQMTNGQTTTQKFPTYVNISGLSTMSVNQSGIAAVPTNCGYAQSTVDGVSGQFAKLSARETDFTFVPQRSVSHSQQKSEQSEGATDGLAQAQNSSLQNLATINSPASTRSDSPQFEWMIKRGMIPLSQANVMDDIEKWLDFDDEDGDFEDGVTSEEFDRFLAERAKAADRLPTINAPWQDSNGPGS